LADETMRIEGVEGAIAGYVIDRPMRTRDALEPLVAALNLTVAERGGQVAVLGAPERVTVLDEAALALPDDGVSVRADRSLEARPGVARVRFIDEATDFQTGTATVRGDGEAGGIDLDLPAVCGAGLARSAAARLLAVGAEDRLTAALDPLAARRPRAGGGVSADGRRGDGGGSADGGGGSLGGSEAGGGGGGLADGARGRLADFAGQPGRNAGRGAGAGRGV